MKDDTDLAMKIATFRFGVFADFVTGVGLGYGGKERRLREKTLQTYEIPGSMRSRITRASMLAWIASYRKGGYRIEALCPKKAYLMAIIDGHSRSFPIDNLRSLLPVRGLRHPQRSSARGGVTSWYPAEILRR